MTDVSTVRTELIDMIMYLPDEAIGQLFIMAQRYQEDRDAERNDPFYSDSNIAHLTRGIAALNAGKGVEHELLEDDPE